MDKNSICGNCLYWKVSAKEKVGECHRHAPKKLDRGGSLLQDWATTGANDFCGDYSEGTPRRRHDYGYGWQKLSQAVRALVGDGDRRQRFAWAVAALHSNSTLLQHPESHFPEEIRDEYVEFVTKMMSLETVPSPTINVTTEDSLDEGALRKAEHKILHFYDTICRYEEPF